MRCQRILFSILLCPLCAWTLEIQPWFGDLFEFHFLGSYAYSRFHAVQGATPPLDDTFQSHIAYLGLDIAVTPEWDIDTDTQIASTTSSPFYWQSSALQARYLWLDDIIGDRISLTTGLSLRATSSTALKDISCPSHGNLDCELNFSLGKEFDSNDTWRFRISGFGSIGHANRGAPWVRGAVALEANVQDVHRFALYALGVNGYGRHSTIDLDQFYGYAKIRQKAIDIGLRYGHHMDIWGTLRFEYVRRLLAKSCPKDVNTWIVSYLIPFSL